MTEMTPLPVIDFEGKTVVPKNGVYRCPFRCGSSAYGPRTWKTERGFRKHMTECPKSPSAIKARQETEQRQIAEFEARKAAALAQVTQKVGDEICYVREIIVKPEYEKRFNRMVRVRYEPVKRFEARRETIRIISYERGEVCFNYDIPLHTLCGSMEEAKARATERQRAWDEHCALAASCR